MLISRVVQDPVDRSDWLVRVSRILALLPPRAATDPGGTPANRGRGFYPTPEVREVEVESL